jgi:hypothetical protein
MKIAYFPNQAALNSEHVIEAFIAGCLNNGHEVIKNSLTADAAVIWSVLFQGRMVGNRQVYETYRRQGKPVFVIEVGSLKRGVLWKISLNNINRLAAWGNEKNLNIDRPAILGLSLQDFRQIRPETVLIATQHERSLQWKGQPSVTEWVTKTIQEVRKYTDRPIVIRPHPRFMFPAISEKNVRTEIPKLIANSYSEYDINFNHHCVINFCSGPSIQAPIAGTPIICDESSLAYPVSIPISSIENPYLPDRTEWFVKLCHTEWAVEEIAAGIPIRRLLEK